MGEVIVKFEREGLEGVVASGSYLFDAARRFGVKFEGDCSDPETGHVCRMKISAGKELLSSPTQTEMEQLTSAARKSGERLACQTIIEKPGELTVMSVKSKKKEEPEVDKSEDFKKEFEELPLEKKIASLVELEAIALGETFSYVLNSPYKAVGKVMDVMAGFGLSMDQADHEAKRPDEHKKDEAKEKPAPKKASRKRTTRKKASPKAAPKKRTAAKRKTSTRATAKKPAAKTKSDKDGDTEK